ncbi:hypothetical protein ACHQM5_030459 [Ranunculus cassubicifolius]
MGCPEKIARMKEYTPHLLMTLCFLDLAILLVFLQHLTSNPGFSSVIYVFYSHLISTILLAVLAFFCERGKRPAFTLSIFLWSFLLGFLQIPLGHLLITESLNYVSATFQSTALNTSNAVTFLMAITFRREVVAFCTINGQAKLWGLLFSILGTTVMVLWPGPTLLMSHISPEIGNRIIGYLMVLGVLLFGSSASLLVEHAARKYSADMTLSAMMCFCGTLQTGIIACLRERDMLVWKINLQGSVELAVILYGGIVVSGVGYYMQTWCIHKRGPVFAGAFNPLLILFTFLLEILTFKKAVHVGSILGAIFVIVGLYLLLWAKADDKEEKLSMDTTLINSYEEISENHV